MRKIQITVEVTRRYCEEIELPTEIYDAFISGDTDELSLEEIDFVSLFDRCRREGEEETDYAIDTDDGKTLVPWND